MVQNTSDSREIVSLTRDSEWISFPGGELEGKRPKALCRACRQQLQNRYSAGIKPRSEGARAPLCFECYRAELDRDRALKAAGQLDTASVERFQTGLPFESVNRPRLDMLKAERSTARVSALVTTSGRFVDRRRRAQIEARHALQRIAHGLAGQRAGTASPARNNIHDMAAAIHAAELQLPESWLPFVVSR